MATVLPAASTADRVRKALTWLERRGTKRNREGMARYGIRAPKVFGVSIAAMQSLARRLGEDHELALALWDTGWYEARILTAFVGEPARVTAAQMDRWARDFDNWGICDTVCFKLFDRTAHAWRKVDQWSGRREEFVRRAAFALLASLALHDKPAEDEKFLRTLPLIEAAAADERNFVKKGVSWALRAIGGKKSPALRAAARELAGRLAASSDKSARWIGKEAMKAFDKPAKAAPVRRVASPGLRAGRRRANIPSEGEP